MVQKFRVLYNPQIYHDIQRQVDYYLTETGSNELGNGFVEAVETALKKLHTSALHYQIRYDDIRLLPIHPFSFRADFRADNENAIARVEAIIHTSEDPLGWKQRTKQ